MEFFLSVSTLQFSNLICPVSKQRGKGRKKSKEIHHQSFGHSLDLDFLLQSFCFTFQSPQIVAPLCPQLYWVKISIQKIAQNWCILFDEFGHIHLCFYYHNTHNKHTHHFQKFPCVPYSPFSWVKALNVRLTLLRNFKVYNALLTIGMMFSGTYSSCVTVTSYSLNNNSYISLSHSLVAWYFYCLLLWLGLF